MLKIPYHEHTPEVKPGSYTAPNCTIVGNVTVEEKASMWYGSVTRAEAGRIHIKKYAAIEDNVVIHGKKKFDTIVGERSVVGHGAILHGCTIGEGCWIGMGTILMNGCVIGDHCLIGAGAMVTQGVEIPPNSLVVGVPGKVKRPLTPEELEMIEGNHKVYFEFAEGQLEETV